MTRAEKVWAVRRLCIRGNENVLWNDHGDVLKRVVSRGVAVPTKITLEDVLKAWRWAFDRKAGHDVGDQDAIDVFDEITSQIRGLWDSGTDLMQQSDACIDFLFQHLEVPKKRTKR